MAKAKVKTLLGTGLAALCSHIKQCNTALGDLSEATANGFEETDDILHEKQDVTAAVSFTIPVDGWGEDDSSPGYFYCDIPIAGLLATDIVDVTVLPEFYDVAGAVGFIATESLEGKLRLRAAQTEADCKAMLARTQQEIQQRRAAFDRRASELLDGYHSTEFLPEERAK